MDIKKLLKGPGHIVKNPEYTGKRDKKHSPTIAIPYTQENTTSVYGAFNKATGDYGNMFRQVENPEKYDEYGITITKQNVDRLDLELADAQSNWEKFGNALLQTTVGEFVLGSAAATADMFTAVPHALALFTDKLLNAVVDDYKENTIQRGLGMDDNPFSNAVGDYFRDLQEKFNNEVAPIYTDPNVNIANGGLNIFSKGGFGWWMKNMPQIASTLTLLVPTKLATSGVSLAMKGVGALAKATKLRKADRVIKNAKKVESLAAAANATDKMEDVTRLNRLQKWFNSPINQDRLKAAGKLTGEALIMRTIENYQEAHQTYQDMYDQSLEHFSTMSQEQYNKFIKDNEKELAENQINASDKEAVAKWVANRAANRTFALDYSNTIFDVMQLYALGNIGKFFGKADNYKVRREHRKDIENLKNIERKKPKAKKGEAKEGTIETNAADTSAPMEISEYKPTKRQRLKEHAWDFVKGSGGLVLSESTEGIEEIVNYIAQQEGITYGNTILKKEPDASLSGFFSNRLKDYAKDPAMWESGFWGIFGGVVFGGVGGAINRIQAGRNYKKAKEQRDKLKKELGLQIEDENVDWLELSEMPQIQAAKASIHRRTAMLNDLAEKINILENRKKDPRRWNKETEEYEALQDEEIQIPLIKKELFDQYVSGLALDAVNANTYDLLADYFASKPVRDTMVNMGVIEENEADSFIQDTLRTLEETKKMYNDELAHVNAQATALNKQGSIEGDIPLEYVMQIARANVDKRIQMRAVDRKLQTLEGLRSTVDPNGEVTEKEQVDAKLPMRIRFLQDYYGRLEAQKRNLKEGKVLDKEGKPLTEWRVAESVDDINREQQACLDGIREAYVGVDGYQLGQEHTAPLLGALLYTIKSSKAYRLVNTPTGQEYMFDGSDEEFKQTDEDIIKNNSTVFGPTKLETATISQERKKIVDSINNLGDKTNGIATRNSRLHDLLEDIVELELERTMLRKDIATTQGQIRNAVDVLHTRRNQVRKEMIAEAEKTIRGLHNKYWGKGHKDLERIIIDTFFSDRAKAYEDAKTKITGTDSEGHSDAEKLISALNILNFSQAANRSAFTYLARILEENSRRHENAEENPTESQNPSEPQQYQQPNNISQQPQQTTTSPKSGQNANVSPSETPTQTATQQPKTTKPVDETNEDIVSRLTEEEPIPEQNAADLEHIREVGFTISSEGKLVITTNPSPSEQKVNVRLVSHSTQENNAPVYEVMFFNPSTQEQNVDNATIGRLASDRTSFNTKGDPIEQDAIPTVVENPEFLVLESNGNILFIPYKTGTIEYKRPNQAQTKEDAAEEQRRQQEEQQKEQNPEQPTTPVEESVESQTTNPSTGEVTDTDAPLTVREIIKDYVCNVAMSGDNYSDFSKVDVNKVKETVRAIVKQNNVNISEEDLEEALEYGIQEAEKTMNEMASLYTGDDLDDAATNMSYFSKLANRNNDAYGSIFKNTLAEFIEEYCSRELVPSGYRYIPDPSNPSNHIPTSTKVKYISIRDIIRICNNITGVNTPENVRNLYGLLMTYFDSEEGLRNYEVIDRDQAESFDDVVDYINIASSSQSINRESAIERVELINPASLSKEAADEFYKAYALLHKGGVVTLYESDNEEWLDVTVDVNGNDVVVGRLPKPNTRADGILYQHNYSVLHDISRNADGTIISRGMDFIKTLFLAPDKDCEAVRQLLMEASTIKNLSEADAIQFGARLANIKLIDDVVTQSVADRSSHGDGYNLFYVRLDKQGNLESPPEYHNIFRGLLNLWNYVYIEGQFSGKDAKTALDKSITQWFEKLADTYELLHDTSSIGQTAEVEKVSEGRFKYAHTKAGSIPYEECKPLNVGLSPRSTFRIARCDTNGVIISNPRKVAQGKPNREDVGFTMKGDLVAVYSRNDSTSFVKAFGARLNDNDAMQGEFLDILKAGIGSVRTCFMRLQEAISNNDGTKEEEIQNLLDILSSLVYSVDDYGKIPILRAKTGKTFIRRKPDNDRMAGFDGIDFTVRLSKDSAMDCKILWQTRKGNILTVAIKNPGDSKYTYYTGVEESFNALCNHLINTMQFNLDWRALDLDNGGLPITNGFITHQTINGERKLRVNIPATEGTLGPVTKKTKGYSKDFDDYNDFVVSANALRVDAEVTSNGTNFDNFTNLHPANRQLRIKINPSSTTNQSISSDKKDSSAPTYMTDYVMGNDTNLERRKEILDLLSKSNDLVKQGKANSLAEAFFNITGRKELYDEIMKEAKDLGIDINLIFPSNITYNEELNVIKEEVDEESGEIRKVQTGPIAITNPEDNSDNSYHIIRQVKTKSGYEYRRVTQRSKPNWVIVGNAWVNMLASRDSSNVNVAFRTLIHERLHLILHDKNTDRADILNRVKEIYDIFKSNFDEAIKKDPTNKDLLYIKKIVEAYDNPRNRKVSKEHLYEEFMVEAMTSSAFFNFMNTIKVDNVGDSTKKETLFNKIINLILKVFKFGKIEEGHLYQKFFNTLRQLNDDSVSREEAIQQSMEERDETASEFEAVVEDVEDTSFDINNLMIDETDYIASVASETQTNNEVYEDISNITQKQNSRTVDTIRRQLPLRNRKAFDKLVERGWIRINC